MLTNASDPAVSKTQATTSAAVKAAEAKAVGRSAVPTAGCSVFNPSRHKGQKVAVKGALIKGAKENGLNVTSLESLAPACL